MDSAACGWVGARAPFAPPLDHVLLSFSFGGRGLGATSAGVAVAASGVDLFLPDGGVGAASPGVGVAVVWPVSSL
jgi:hypothetical protein